MQLPEIIGHPGYERTPDGAPSRAYETRLDQTLMIAEIKPKDIKSLEYLNYLHGEDALGEYKQYLSGNFVSMSTDVLKVCINNISPFSESFTNEFSPSSILAGLQDIVSSTVNELNMRTGDSFHDVMGNNAGEFLENAKARYKKDNSPVNAALLKLANLENDYVGQGKVRNMIHGALSHAAHKMDIPSIWRGNSQSISYDLSIRLSCYNASNQTAFEKYILAPIIALKQFSCPRTDDKDVARYKWPFLMEFNIAGVCQIPLAYCSSLTVVKGGDINDFQWLNDSGRRPNMVDLRMTVNPIHNIQLNAKEGTLGDERPTIFLDVAAMNSSREQVEANLNDNMERAAMNFERTAQSFAALDAAQKLGADLPESPMFPL